MIHLIHGQDTYRSQVRLREVIEEAGVGPVVFFDAAERSVVELARELGGGSLFDEVKTIVVKEILTSKESERFVEFLSEWKGDDVVVVYGGEDVATMSRSKKSSAAKKDLAKKILKLGEVHHIKALSDAERPKWLIDQAAQLGTTLQPAAANMLAKSSKDSWHLITQLHKLAALSNYKTIDTQLAQEFSEQTDAPDQNIFPLLDAVVSNNKARALELLGAQFQKDPKSEFYVLTMFLYQFRIMLSVGDLVARNMSPDAIKKELSLHPFVIQKSLGAVRRFEFTHLKKIFSKLVQLHDDLKFKPLPARTQLEQFVLEL